MLDRRQFIAGSTLAVFSAALPSLGCAKPAFGLRFAKGAPVPEWLEIPTHPGFFGVDVEMVGGGKELVSYPMPADYADTFFAIRVAPSRPLQLGECLVRYKGGSGPSFRCHGAGVAVIWDGGPDAVMWVEDGPDLLSAARVSEPEFRRVTPRLATRVPVGRSRFVADASRAPVAQ